MADNFKLSPMARIRVGPNSRNKVTIYTRTRVTGPTGNPPEYSTEILQFDSATSDVATVIGKQDSSSNGKIIWNDDASDTVKKYQSTIAKASTNQVNSIKDDIATTAEEKEALNKISGSNNTAIDSGTDTQGVAAQSKSEAREEWDPNFGVGQRDDFSVEEELDEDVQDKLNNMVGAKSGTRNKFDDLLVYPTTLRQDNQDTIWFTMMEYIPKKMSDNRGGLTNSDRGTSESRSIGKVCLPIPGGINDSNNANWASGEMNAGQMAMARIALGGIVNGFEGLAAETVSTLEKVSANKEEVKNALAQSIAGAATGDNKALMQRTSGQVINPNMELLFGGPALRDFSFAFNFTARNAPEAKTILKIIRFFKQGMAPIKSTSNLFLKSPHTFKLEYKNGNKTHKALNRFKECALKTCSLQYTPDGNYATFEDGIMTKYQMTLAFTELEPVFNNDYSENGIGLNEIGY
tara:strand:- start:31 stop:1419 length:1389 start_codon:yes stop_codon:yes gene_type:complete